MPKKNTTQNIFNYFSIAIHLYFYSTYWGYQGSTPGSPSLIINFAKTGSNGVYACFARNAVGTGSSNPTTLTITGG
jgi:hypothetical protein